MTVMVVERVVRGKVMMTMTNKAAMECWDATSTAVERVPWPRFMAKHTTTRPGWPLCGGGLTVLSANRPYSTLPHVNISETPGWVFNGYVF